MEQNKVVDAIKAVLGDGSQASHNDGGTGSNYNITINGNVSITVQAPSCPTSSGQATASHQLR